VDQIQIRPIQQRSTELGLYFDKQPSSALSCPELGDIRRDPPRLVSREVTIVRQHRRCLRVAY
jgi:hypothetical protein